MTEWVKKGTHRLVDVRTPSEFAKGHIPGAVNIPLFSDEDRARIGTTYKQENPEQAFDLGLELLGPKLAQLVRQFRESAAEDELVVHCWRGGMRSQSVASLLQMSGMKVSFLSGGYKAYRQWVTGTLAKPCRLLVLGGYTGSGKTMLLHRLREAGKQVIDLEGLAKHKGSAFGNLDDHEQPSNEQFENALAGQLQQIDPERIVWVEDESRMVGRVFLRDEWFGQMQQAHRLFLDIPAEERAAFLVKDYMNQSPDPKRVEDALEQIRKRLGGQHYQAALHDFREGKLADATLKVLRYYDKAYDRVLAESDPGKIKRLEFDTIDPESIIKKLIQISCSVWK